MSEGIRPGGNRDRRGAKNPNAKLTAEKVREIHLRRSTGEKYTSIAKDMKCHQSTIGEVIRGISWREIPQ